MHTCPPPPQAMVGGDGPSAPSDGLWPDDEPAPSGGMYLRSRLAQVCGCLGVVPGVRRRGRPHRGAVRDAICAVTGGEGKSEMLFPGHIP